MLLTIITLVLYYFMLFCTIFWLLVLLENQDRLFIDPKPHSFPTVSIIIPVYNGEGTIGKCIESCLELQYPKGKLEVIVVNDGSTDGTRKISEKFARKKLIKLINQKNAGKAAAINTGLKYSKGELVACMDADSYYEPDALYYMIGYFDSRKVGAVTPSIKITRSQTVAEKVQWVEYLFSIYLRKLMSLVNALHVIPGPGSIYRAKVLKEVNGFDEGNLTEDMDIAFKVHARGYEIANSLNSYVYTVAPARVDELTKQRVRWYLGYFQNIKKHSHFVMNREFADLGLFVLPINFLWVFATLFLFSVSLKDIGDSVWRFIRDVFLVKTDIFLLLSQFSIETYLFRLNVIDVFLTMFLLLSIIVIYLSIRLSGEQVDIKGKKFHYLSYLFLYFPLYSIFWTLSVIYELTDRSERKWLGGKLK